MWQQTKQNFPHLQPAGFISRMKLSHSPRVAAQRRASPEFALEPLGSFRNLGVLFVDALITGARLFWVCNGAPDFCKLPPQLRQAIAHPSANIPKDSKFTRLLPWQSFQHSKFRMVFEGLRESTHYMLKRKEGTQ